ncbi:hypothetical protein SLS56_008385 [Neofusicoccum ribis]|uniref:protein S-acyltransferase n=1 Tax=Neofusicoccum ribis TaxID=45134 RepID=A0ABR3SKW7_9PEZI
MQTSDKNDFRAIPLHRAAKAGHPEVAGLIIKRGADVDAQDTTGNTPLVTATWNRHPQVMEVLLRNGADRMTIGVGGHPIQLSSIFNQTDMLAILLKYSKDIPELVNIKRTALGYAMEEEQIIEMLLQDFDAAAAGAARDNGRTPLHEAAKAGDVDKE